MDHWFGNTKNVWFICMAKMLNFLQGIGVLDTSAVPKKNFEHHKFRREGFLATLLVSVT